MTWRGMDTESVQTLGDDLRDAGMRVQDLAVRLEARLADTEWIGQDAGRFRDDWEGRLRVTLEEARAALATAAGIAERHVHGQMVVSD